MNIVTKKQTLATIFRKLLLPTVMHRHKYVKQEHDENGNTKYYNILETRSEAIIYSNAKNKTVHFSICHLKLWLLTSRKTLSMV